MNVLHIITGLGGGGAEAVLFRLCTHDTQNRHHVISLMDSGKYGPLLEKAGVRVTTLDMPRGRVTLSGVRRLWKLVRREKPDVIQTWMYHADLVGGGTAWLAGARNIVWGLRHSTLDPVESTRGTILVTSLCARLSRYVPRQIVCCAEKAREVHSALGYDAGRMRVIPNGYDLSVFRPDPEAGAALRAELGIGREQPLIGFAARFDPQKDHATLLNALALLKVQGRAPMCLLAGSGLTADNAAIIGMIEDLDLTGEVRLLGRRNDISAFMNALDLHVMSSAFGEGFPNVLAEAMACGTPCVSTDVGDAAIIVGDSGWIVPPRDATALADAIALALTKLDRPDWGTRKAAAREHVKTNFSITRMVDNYRDIWFGGTAM